MKRCACGCGEPVVGRKTIAIYATDACKVRACKRRRRVAAYAAQETVTAADLGLKPSARRVLRVLQIAGPGGATTHELGQAAVGGFRFGARIHEIRLAGFRVREQRERNGSSRYWLLEHADAPRLVHVTQEAA